jgi:hypothetical protein
MKMRSEDGIEVDVQVTEDDLCPDCTTPYLVVTLQGELRRYYHDPGCPVLVAASRRRRPGVNAARD